MVVAGPEGFIKNAYRKFNIKTVLPNAAPGELQGGDDYAMMHEVLTRRFSRALKEDPDRELGHWPDLILIDGGAGHLSTTLQVFEDLGITASAGISSNKFLAKIASDWNKPNGQYSIPDKDIKDFIIKVPIRKIYGVGKKTELLLKSNGVNTCKDLQKLSKESLSKLLGKYGCTLYSLSRGIDDREVESHKISKSLSVEDTYMEDLTDLIQALKELKLLYLELLKRLDKKVYANRLIKSCYVKIKYSDFKLTTTQVSSKIINYEVYSNLLKKTLLTNNKSIRLLGVGVQFNNEPISQLNLDIT